VYLTEEGVSFQRAHRRELVKYATVLRLLQRADSDKCTRILEALRRPKTMADGVEDVLKG
jgi:hypothetical protein